MAEKRTSRRKDPARKIADLLAAIEGRFGQDIKFTVGDYIRLLQAAEEFDRDTPRDIEVTWVDSLKPTKESDK
jgi:hypothetical protein